MRDYICGGCGCRENLLRWMYLLILINVKFAVVASIDHNMLDIYKHNKSTWAKNDIVFALNLPSNKNICDNCHDKHSGSGYNLAEYYASAAAIAVEDINNDDTILKNHKLRYVWNINETDTHYHELEAIRIQLKQIEIGVHGFVGFDGYCRTVSKNAAAVNLPIFSMSCAEMDLSNKSNYPTFARTTVLNIDIIYMIQSLFEKLNWKKFAIIYEDSGIWLPIYEELNDLIQKNSSHGMSITLEEKYKKSQAFDKVHENIDHVLGPFLDKLPQKARVVLLMIDKGYLYPFLKLAVKKGLTNGEYAFIAVHPFVTSERLIYNSAMASLAWFLPWKGLEGSIPWIDHKNVRAAFQSLMILMPEPPQVIKNGSHEQFQERVRNCSSKPPFNFINSYKPENKSLAKAQPPKEADRLYDAVMVYAVGLNKTIANGQSFTNGTAIIENIMGLELKSINGQKFIINAKADVQTYFEVLQFQLLDCKPDIEKYPTCWSPKKVFELKPDYNASSSNLIYRVKKANNTLIWLTGHIPFDEPVCGFHNEKCIEKKKPNNPVLPISVTFLTVIFIIITIFLYRNYRLKKELNSQMWKIDATDLFFHDWRSVSKSSLGSLISQTLSVNETTKNYTQRFTTVAIYKGAHVAIKKVNKKTVDLNKTVLLELKQMRDVRHDNLNQFIGACVEPNNIFIVYQYTSKGSLQDVLENHEIKLDTLFILSLVYDIIRGMIYLHSTDIKSHGNLKSSNCVVDSRWVLKITDYGLKTFKSKQGSVSLMKIDNSNNLLWKAPELLRLDDSMSLRGTQKGDMFSFGIILQECQTRDGAWGSTCQDSEVIIERMRKVSNPPFRPIVPKLLDGAEGLRDVMKRCWLENPDDRPNFCEIRKDVEAMMKANGLKANIFDNMIYMMGKYSDDLEEIVEERTSSLIDEKHKVEALLERMLPQSVARQLMKGQEVEAETFEEVTIYFSDIVGFTNICSSISPMEVVELLNCLYTMFDGATKEYDVYKVETIGDAYMVVSGLPIRNGKQHVKEIALFSLDILESVQSFKMKHNNHHQLKIRIGIHCGPVVAGVVGTTMPRYCLFGDTVNVSSRMESTGQAFRIHISKDVKDALTCFHGFRIESRGLTQVKGKGEIETYWLIGADSTLMRRGAYMAREQDDLYRNANNTSIYKFIQESPRTKQGYQKLNVIPDYLSRSTSVPHSGPTSGGLSRKNRKYHNGSVGSFVPSGLIKKKENSDSKQDVFLELMNTENNTESNQLLNPNVNYATPNLYTHFDGINEPLSNALCQF